MSGPLRPTHPVTPINPQHMRRASSQPVWAALRDAWTNPGRARRWHDLMKREVRITMPMLAEALDRLVATPRDVDPSPEPEDRTRPVPAVIDKMLELHAVGLHFDAGELYRSHMEYRRG